MCVLYRCVYGRKTDAYCRQMSTVDRQMCMYCVYIQYIYIYCILYIYILYIYICVCYCTVNSETVQTFRTQEANIR
jgi:hypothetical protein